MFTSDRIGGEFAFRLFTMTADGQNQTPLPGGSSGNYIGDEDPAWSPDGVKLAGVRKNWFLDGIVLFIGNIFGTWEILDWNPESNFVQSRRGRLTEREIAYGAVIPLYVEHHNSEIFVINADGSGVTRLTNTPPVTRVTRRGSLSFAAMRLIALSFSFASTISTSSIANQIPRVSLAGSLCSITVQRET